MNHLKNYIGVYLLALVLIAINFDDPNDEYPVIIWWLALAVVLFKTPPFNWADWLLDKWARFLQWIMGPFINWVKTWPKWLRIVWAIGVIVVFEEYFLSPLGYTVYPWRMDFGW